MGIINIKKLIKESQWKEMETTTNKKNIFINQ